MVKALSEGKTNKHTHQNPKTNCYKIIKINWMTQRSFSATYACRIQDQRLLIPSKLSTVLPSSPATRNIRSSKRRWKQEQKKQESDTFKRKRKEPMMFLTLWNKKTESPWTYIISKKETQLSQGVLSLLGEKHESLSTNARVILWV